MNNQPKWIIKEELACIRNWTDYLYAEARRLYNQDGTHANLVFCFTKEDGLISINPIPPNIDHEQLNTVIRSAVNEHHLYGIIFIGEIWMYYIKENDHTSFQLLDGEMKVSDLNNKDKREALVVRMENREGECLIYLNEINREENRVVLKECEAIKESSKKWFRENQYQT